MQMPTLVRSAGQQGRPARPRRPRWQRPGAHAANADRGSVTVFVIFYTLVALLLAALLVDGGSAVNAQERAGDIAEQAARAAADTVSVPDLRAGQVVIDQSQACGKAAQLIQQYVQGTNVQATMTKPCTYPSARQVTVYVSVTTTPVFSLFPPFTMKAAETACAEFGVAEGEAC